MTRVLKQTRTINGSTSSSLWTYKIVIDEYFEDNYATTNKSIVVVSDYLGRGSSGSYIGGNFNVSNNADGQGKSFSGNIPYPTTINANGWYLLGSSEFEIQHADDGRKTITVNSTMSSSDFNPNSAIASGQVELTTIPRASSIAVSNTDLGQNVAITIGKKVDSFKNTLTYKIGSLTGTIVEKTNEKQYVWEMTSTLINQIKNTYPSTKEVDTIIYCKTYDGNTQIGSTTEASFKLIIVDKPTISSVVRAELNTSISALTTNVLKSASQNRFTITAAAPTGTTIAKYVVENGQRAESTTNVVNFNDVQNSYTSSGILKTKFLIYAVDKRGNTSEPFEAEYNFTNYINVSINKTDVVIKRTNAITNDCIIYAKGNFFNGNIGNTTNTITFKVRTKLKDSSSWSSYQTLAATYSGNTFTINNVKLTGVFDYHENYDVELVATDRINISDSYSRIFATSVPAEKHHKNGAWFKEIGFDAFDNKTHTVNAIKKMLLDYEHPVGSLYWSSNPTNPSELFGGTWTQIKDKFVLSAGDIYNVNDTGGNSINPDIYCGGTGYGFQLNSSAYADRTLVRSVALSDVHGEISAEISNMPPYIVKYCWERTS